MSKKAFPLLTGGLNEVTRPDLIEDNELQVCTNYEVVGDGVLRRRKDIADYGLSLSNAEYISEPYYPEKLFEGQTNDFILFVYGNNELHGHWQDANGWTNLFDGSTLNTVLSDSGVTYTDESDVQIVIGSDKVIITDGVNPVHFVSVDNDGILRAGIMGIPAPKNKAQVTEMTEWQSDLWETDSTASRLSTPGLFQCIYTVVTKYGEESNPSPLSDTLDMQFFKLDSDGIDERWLEKVEIKGLNIPDVPQNVQDNLKYFKVYFRVIRYSEGEGTKALEFSEQFEIANKTTDATGTGNDYTLTVAVSPGEIASYENDIAPIAKTAAEIGGITMAGNVKTKIRFPFDFKYYHKITINNKDSKSYVDAIIRIRLKESEIDNFTVSDFVNSDKKLKNSEHIRLYDNDMTTPLMVAYNGYNDSGYASGSDYIDLFIKIPLLTAASPKTIYLCWTPDGETGYDGVSSDYNDLTAYDSSWISNIGIHYGRFMVIDFHGWSRQEVWGSERVKSGSLFCMDDVITDYEKSGKTATPVLTDSQWVTTTAKTLKNNIALSVKGLQLDQITSSADFSMESYAVPDRGSIYGRVIIPYTPTLVGKILTIQFSSNTLGIRVENSLGQGYWYRGVVAGIDTDILSLREESNYTNDNYSFIILYSWDKTNKKTSLFTINLDDETEINKVTQDEDKSYFDIMDTITNIKLGGEGSAYSYDDAVLNRWNIISGTFFDAGSVDDVSSVKNIFNFMPAFDNMIGYDYTDHNNNIDFDETKEIKYKEFRNMVKWTDVNYQSFADLFFKKVREPILKIMPAPSFLQFEYQNTFIIFTRNSINRFVLSGSADGWSGSSSSLIEEKTQYGLLAEKSLVRAGDALFWLSEVGVVMWGKDGMGLISKNVVNVPIKSSSIGFYAPLNNQYIIHDNTDLISYVFHIDRGTWAKFTGFDIVSVATMTAGSQYDNINLLLNSDGELKKYPIDSYITEDSEIQTKDMFFEKGTLRRMKADFVNGTSNVIMKSIMTTRKADGTEKVNTNTITNPNSGQWRGTSLENSRGESVSFGIKNADEIKHIMYDLKVEE